MGRISRDARLTFILLWTLADDSGRLRGNSRMLASRLFPYDNDAADKIDGWLAELEGVDSILRYDVGNDRYIEIRNWLKHQKIEKPSASKHPPFVEDSPNVHRIFGEGSRTVAVGREGKGEEGKGEEKHTRASRSLRALVGFEEFWLAYPKRRSKGQAEKAWRKINPDGECVARIMAGLTSAKTRSDWAKDDGRFVPYPATWLNNRGWEDDGNAPPTPLRNVV
jgi:hypothetical protein